VKFPRDVSGAVAVKAFRRLSFMGLTRAQSDGILQDTLWNFARWVNNTHGVEIWTPAGITRAN